MSASSAAVPEYGAGHADEDEQDEKGRGVGGKIVDDRAPDGLFEPNLGRAREQKEKGTHDALLAIE